LHKPKRGSKQGFGPTDGVRLTVRCRGLFAVFPLLRKRGVGGISAPRATFCRYRAVACLTWRAVTLKVAPMPPLRGIVVRSGEEDFSF
jgi:hypothetical protein